MDLRIDGRHALVTGASRGLGRAIALSLASEGGSLLRFTMPLAKTERPATAGEAGVHPAALSVAGARVGGGFDIAQFLT
jgi:3-oxoacyl-[acyl-carrier protein] reductase